MSGPDPQGPGRYQPFGPMRPRAVVIGGGLAGLAAAHELTYPRAPSGRRLEGGVRDGTGVVVLESNTLLGGKARSLDGLVGMSGHTVGNTDKGYHIFPRWYWDMWTVMAEAGLVSADEHQGCTGDGCVQRVAEGSAVDLNGATGAPVSRFTCPAEAASRDYTLVKIHPDEHVEAVSADISLRTVPAAASTFAVMMGLVGADTERLDRRSLEDHLLGRWYAGNSTLERVREIVLKALANPSFDASARTTANTFRRWLPVYRDANWRALRGPLQHELIEPFAESLRARGVSIHTDAPVARIVVERSDELEHDVFMVTRIELEAAPGEERGRVMDTTSCPVVLAMPHEILARRIDWAEGVVPPHVSTTATARERRRADPATTVRDLSYLESAAMASLDLYLGELPGIGRHRSPFPDAHFSLIGSQYAITGFVASNVWRDRYREGFPPGASHLVQFVCSDVRSLQGLSTRDAARLLRADIGRFIPELAPGGHGSCDPVIESVLLMNDSTGDQVTRNEAGSWDRRPAAEFGLANAWLAGDFCRCPVDVASMEAAVSSGLIAGRLAAIRTGSVTGGRGGSAPDVHPREPGPGGSAPVSGWPGGSHAVWRRVLTAVSWIGAAASFVVGNVLRVLALPYRLARRAALSGLESDPLRRRARDTVMMWCGPGAIVVGTGAGAVAWARSDGFDAWTDPYSTLAAIGAPGRGVLVAACLVNYVLLMVFAVPVRRFLPWSRQTTAGMLLASLGYLAFPFVPVDETGAVSLGHGIAAAAILLGPNWSVVAATAGLHHGDERYARLEWFVRRWVWIAVGVIVATAALAAFGVLTFVMQVVALSVGGVWFVVLGVFLLQLRGPASSVPGIGPDARPTYIAAS